MLKRILLAALAGGLALFVWESVAHMALPLGQAGLSTLTDEPAVMAALQSGISQPGFYFFPGPQCPPGATREQRAEAMRTAMEKYRAGAHGILIYHPRGSDPMPPWKLFAQAATDLVQILIAAALLAMAGPLAGYGRRVVFVALLGLLPCLAVDLPYWNWYGFPAVYTLAQCVMHIGGYLVAGFVVAALMKPGAAGSRQVAA